MAFMKYLTLYSGKEDPESWLKSYKSPAKAEKWSILHLSIFFMQNGSLSSIIILTL